MKKKNVMKKRPLRRYRKGSIADQIRSIPAGDKREWPLADVNVTSYRTKAGELNVDADRSQFSVKVYPDYGTMVITNHG